MLLKTEPSLFLTIFEPIKTFSKLLILAINIAFSFFKLFTCKSDVILFCLKFFNSFLTSLRSSSISFLAFSLGVIFSISVSSSFFSFKNFWISKSSPVTFLYWSFNFSFSILKYLFSFS
jgi:hypothetical protein